MKKNLLILISSIMLLTACTNDTGANTPTGYVGNEIEQPQLMYNDEIYYYQATGFDEELPEGYVKAGTIQHVDNENPPSENFSGARIDTGQEIFCSNGDNAIVYVAYESGYARFCLKEQK